MVDDADAATDPARIEASHREQRIPRREAAVRRVVVALITLFCILGLANTFGQRSSVESATTGVAGLELDAPARIRSGLIGQARITVSAHQAVAAPRLVLSPGWLHQLTLNTVTPQADAERATPGGGVAYAYPPLEAGESLVVVIEFQVNPTAIGRRDWGVSLRDGDRPMVAVDRAGPIFP